mgnify:CR=1 FL=1
MGKTQMEGEQSIQDFSVQKENSSSEARVRLLQEVSNGIPNEAGWKKRPTFCGRDCRATVSLFPRETSTCRCHARTPVHVRRYQRMGAHNIVDRGNVTLAHRRENVRWTKREREREQDETEF